MRIASYNVNGINGRLAVLPRWLEETWEKTSDHAPIWIELADG